MGLYLKLNMTWQEGSRLPDFELYWAFHPPYEAIPDPWLKLHCDFSPERGSSSVDEG